MSEQTTISWPLSTEELEKLAHIRGFAIERMLHSPEHAASDYLYNHARAVAVLDQLLTKRPMPSDMLLDRLAETAEQRRNGLMEQLRRTEAGE